MMLNVDGEARRASLGNDVRANSALMEAGAEMGGSWTARETAAVEQVAASTPKNR